MGSSPQLSALVLGVEGDWGLIGSYGRALSEAGVAVTYWNLPDAVDSHARLGNVGRRVAKYFPVESWITKANRDLINRVMESSPALVIYCGVEVRAGALAQIKVAKPQTRLVQVWQDTMLNLSDRMIECMRVVDLVACYSERTVEQLRNLGAKNVIWAPFAMDGELFPSEVEITAADKRRFSCDISFIGNHRPEREREILRLCDAGLDVKVWAANTWPKVAQQKSRVADYFQGEPLFGKDMVKAMRCSTLALNLIDPMNYPAANMRVFETYACGGTPLCSRCPEIEPIFPGGESAFYFEEPELPRVALELIADKERAARVGRQGRARALDGHRYVDRVRSILKTLGLDSDAPDH